MDVTAIDVLGRTDLFTPLQRERYQKVLTATIELIRQNGYDATTIRAVAQAARVGNGTIYRYFKSRDALIYMATAQWGVPLGIEQRKRERPAAQTAEQRILASVFDGTEAMIAEPNLLEAWIVVRHSTDPALVELMRSSDEYQAVNNFSFPDPSTSPLRRDLSMIMEAQTTDGLWKWARGIISWETFRENLLDSVRLVFRAHQAGDAP